LDPDPQKNGADPELGCYNLILGLLSTKKMYNERLSPSLVKLSLDQQEAAKAVEAAVGPNPPKRFNVDGDS